MSRRRIPGGWEIWRKWDAPLATLTPSVWGGWNYTLENNVVIKGHPDLMDGYGWTINEIETYLREHALLS